MNVRFSKEKISVNFAKNNILKGRHIALIVVLLLVLDQVFKFYIKLNYHLGEDHNIIGNWFRLNFVENPGMAWGWQFGGGVGKMLLTLFRLGAVIWGIFYIRKISRKKLHPGFVLCVSLIFAGAAGNLIDSMFYGMIFDKGLVFDPALKVWTDYEGVAALSTPGYSSFLHGVVVDMLYFPIIQHYRLPAWIPFWGGETVNFFQYIFNLADAYISVGVIALLIWQKKFFPEKASAEANNKTI